MLPSAIPTRPISSPARCLSKDGSVFNYVTREFARASFGAQFALEKVKMKSPGCFAAGTHDINFCPLHFAEVNPSWAERVLKPLTDTPSSFQWSLQTISVEKLSALTNKHVSGISISIKDGMGLSITKPGNDSSGALLALPYALFKKEDCSDSFLKRYRMWGFIDEEMSIGRYGQDNENSDQNSILIKKYLIRQDIFSKNTRNSNTPFAVSPPDTSKAKTPSAQGAKLCKAEV